jgi:hypothetical protein
VDIIDLVQFGLLVVVLPVSFIALWTRRRIAGVSSRPPHATDLLLKELLERSRHQGGRVHIHEVEEAVRRHLG